MIKNTHQIFLKSKKRSYAFLMVVLKLILDVIEKFRKVQGTQAVIGEATRPKHETYNRCSRVDDEEQKKVLSVFNGSFLRNFVGGDHIFFNFLKRVLSRNIWKTLLQSIKVENDKNKGTRIKVVFKSFTFKIL